MKKLCALLCLVFCIETYARAADRGDDFYKAVGVEREAFLRMASSNDRIQRALEEFVKGLLVQQEIMNNNVATLQSRGHHGPASSVLVIACELEKLSGQARALLAMEKLFVANGEAKASASLVAEYYKFAEDQTKDFVSSIRAVMETHPGVSDAIKGLAKEGMIMGEAYAQRGQLLGEK